MSEASYGVVASLTVLTFSYLGGITSVSGAVTAGLVAASGVAFYTMNQAIGSFGAWGAYIGGVLLIVTAIQNPEGLSGAIRSQVADAHTRRALKQSASGVATTEAAIT